MYAQPRRYLWYLALIVLLLFVVKSPVTAAHLAHTGGNLLSVAASALSKFVRAI